jgi:Spy/CpxP family protein refolding chaperone
MNNGRFYKIVIILLLLLNGGILAFLWVKGNNPEHEHPGGRPGHGRVDRLMSDKLHFTQEQEQQMQVLKDEHHGQIMEIQKEEQQLHKELFQLLKAPSTDTIAKNNLMARLGANDLRKEEVTFEHFRKIRAILKPEQLPMFDELMEEIASHIMAPHRGGRPGMPPPPPPGAEH